jgi:hypothetical protein
VPGDLFLGVHAEGEFVHRAGYENDIGAGHAGAR